MALTPELLAEAYDFLWREMDQRYSYFAFKPGVDWQAMGERHRRQALAAPSLDAFAEVLRVMLAELRDPHIFIETPAGLVGTFGIPYRGNWNPKVGAKTYTDPVVCGEFALVGTTAEEGYGYVVINKQSRATPESVCATVAAIQERRNAPGFLVDLRGGASGGNESLARLVAQAFCEEPVVYAMYKYRNGPGHGDFAPVNKRWLPAGDSPYLGPVVCLIGHRCMSSGEALVMMMDALPQVTTVGDSTRGASGNPKSVALPKLDLAVRFSTWVALQPDGEPFEGVGIQPNVQVDAPPSAYRDADPTLERALEELRAAIKQNRLSEATRTIPE